MCCATILVVRPNQVGGQHRDRLLLQDGETNLDCLAGETIEQIALPPIWRFLARHSSRHGGDARHQSPLNSEENFEDDTFEPSDNVETALPRPLVWPLDEIDQTREKHR